MNKLWSVLALVAVVAYSAEAHMGFLRGKMTLNREPVISNIKSTRIVELDVIEQRVDNFDPSNWDTYQMVICFFKYLKSWYI